MKIPEEKIKLASFKRLFVYYISHIKDLPEELKADYNNALEYYSYKIVNGVAPTFINYEVLYQIKYAPRSVKEIAEALNEPIKVVQKAVDELYLGALIYSYSEGEETILELTSVGQEELKAYIQKKKTLV